MPIRVALAQQALLPNPGSPFPAGNFPSQPPRFRPNGEPFLVSSRAPDSEPPCGNQ
jgi:hypothetical protein